MLVLLAGAYCSPRHNITHIQTRFVSFRIRLKINLQTSRRAKISWRPVQVIAERTVGHFFLLRMFSESVLIYTATGMRESNSQQRQPGISIPLRQSRGATLAVARSPRALSWRTAAAAAAMRCVNFRVV